MLHGSVNGDTKKGHDQAGPDTAEQRAHACGGAVCAIFTRQVRYLEPDEEEAQGDTS